MLCCREVVIGECFVESGKHGADGLCGVLVAGKNVPVSLNVQIAAANAAVMAVAMAGGTIVSDLLPLRMAQVLPGIVFVFLGLAASSEFFVDSWGCRGVDHTGAADLQALVMKSGGRTNIMCSNNGIKLLHEALIFPSSLLSVNELCQRGPKVQLIT